MAAKNYDVVASVLSDVGCHRTSNEDSGRWIKPLDSATLQSKGMLAIVADGMGGHSAGEVASQLAVEIINKAYYAASADPEIALREALLEANRQIYESSQADRALQGMGTTCTALALYQDLAVHAHVGDSRLYMVRDGSMYQMSEDHSAVGKMVAQGQLSRAEARQHPDKNVILRALGTRSGVEVSTWDQPFPVRAQDQFLLCSDGLYDLVEDKDILQVVLEFDVHEACERLVALARDAGGHDNITVSIVCIRDGDKPTPSVRDTRGRKVVS